MKRYVCSLCKKNYATLWSLMKHFKSKHPGTSYKGNYELKKVEDEFEAIRLIMRIRGKYERDKCSYYDKKSGACLWYVLSLPKEIKEKFPSYFKTVGGKDRFFVMERPEVCALCRRIIHLHLEDLEEQG